MQLNIATLKAKKGNKKKQKLNLQNIFKTQIEHKTRDHQLCFCISKENPRGVPD